MKLKQIFAFLSIAFLVVEHAQAQQDAMFTHYMYNTLGVNPGYAGSRDALTLTALHRSQWVGYAGAPMTQTLTLHSPIKKDNIGLGLSLINDRIGPLNNTSVYFDFAYRIKLDNKSKLSLGIKGGLNMLRAKLNTLNLDELNDNSFQITGGALAPNFGFGIYYSRDRFYAGLSVPRLLENNFKPGTATTNIAVKEKRHYFFIAGSAFKLSKTVDFKPTTFVKVTQGAPIEADFTGTFVLKNLLHIGAMFRTGDAFGALLGYNITDQLFLSYSFDWSYALKTVTYHGGSHELVLRYDFIYTVEQKIRSPRYF